jgi:hypothetical protein
MIKQSGEYLAVKIPCCANDISLSGDFLINRTNYWDRKVLERLPIKEGEIIGRMSEITLKQKHDFFLALGEGDFFPEDELDQWLIVKKIK